MFGALPLSSHPAKKTKAAPSAMHLTSLTTLFVFISSWDESWSIELFTVKL
jgi:hypothetical protein